MNETSLNQVLSLFHLLHLVLLSSLLHQIPLPTRQQPTRNKQGVIRYRGNRPTCQTGKTITRLTPLHKEITGRKYTQTNRERYRQASEGYSQSIKKKPNKSLYH